MQGHLDYRLSFVRLCNCYLTIDTVVGMGPSLVSGPKAAETVIFAQACRSVHRMTVGRRLLWRG